MSVLQHTVMYHELDVTAYDIELVLHRELAIEVQQNKGHPRETHSRAGQDAAPQGTVEGRLLHCCSHLLQQGVGSMETTGKTQWTWSKHQHCPPSTRALQSDAVHKAKLALRSEDTLYQPHSASHVGRQYLGPSCSSLMVRTTSRISCWFLWDLVDLNVQLHMYNIYCCIIAPWSAGEWVLFP